MSLLVLFCALFLSWDLPAGNHCGSKERFLNKITTKPSTQLDQSL